MLAEGQRYVLMTILTHARACLGLYQKRRLRQKERFCDMPFPSRDVFTHISSLPFFATIEAGQPFGFADSSGRLRAALAFRPTSHNMAQAPPQPGA